MAEMIDLFSQCRPYIEPHGDADSRRLLREIDAAGWQPIETAPKDGIPILLVFKETIPREGRPDIKRWEGLQFVGRHPGLADDGFDIGWNFAAPVGMGGFPDDWFAGWMPLPAAPATAEQAYRDSNLNT